MYRDVCCLSHVDIVFSSSDCPRIKVMPGSISMYRAGLQGVEAAGTTQPGISLLMTNVTAELVGNCDHNHGQ